MRAARNTSPKAILAYDEAENLGTICTCAFFLITDFQESLGQMWGLGAP